MKRTSGHTRDKVKKVEQSVAAMMNALGLDLSAADMKETPNRVARMYCEIFSGMNAANAPEITVFPNEEKYGAMIVVKDIPFYSICSHHLVPFFGVGHIAYIPNRWIAGLSKLARVVEFFAKKPQMQERLTEEISSYLTKKLSPRGVMVMLEARHLCMEMRGIEKHGAVTVTSATSGVFDGSSESERFRNDFMMQVSAPRKAGFA